MHWLTHAPSNIALIKYMGKRDASNNIPDNASLSYTLSHLVTYVGLEINDKWEDNWLALAPSNLNPTGVKTLHQADFNLNEYRDKINQQCLSPNLSLKGQQRFISHLQYLKKNHQHKKLAVVLDIDETSLSNYAAIIHGKFNTDVSRFSHLLKGNDPAILPMLSLYKQTQKAGVAVFFVTGRREKLCPSTKKNLRKEGFTQWSEVYCRPQTDENPSIIPYKTAMRKKISQDGYVIIANIGDQKSDLKGGYAEQTYKLPNPFYFLP